MKRLILGLAAVALLFSPLAADAGGRGRHNHDSFDISQSLDVDVEIDWDFDVDVTLETDVDKNFDSDIKVVGSEGRLWRYLTVDGYAMAEVHNEQIIKENEVRNKENPNTATITGNAMQNAVGNIGLNVVAGDNNLQANSASIVNSDELRSMVDAEIYSLQMTVKGDTENKGRTNKAKVSGNSFQNATGNLGVNEVAGNNNAQANMLAIANAPSKVGVASVAIMQETARNYTSNRPVERTIETKVDVDLKFGAFGGYIGGYSGRTSGTYEGASYQQDNFYPDRWEDSGGHPSGGNDGHNDWDYQTQGAVLNTGADGQTQKYDDNGDPIGGIAFDEYGTYEGSERGLEAGLIGLTGSVTGSFPVIQHINKDMVNIARIDGNAFRHAAGNIGVNIAAGTGNLQANALAVTNMCNGCVLPPYAAE